MENTIYIGLSRQIALESQMNLIANNMANMTTPGFKANKIMFKEFLDRPQGMNETMSMVLDYGNFRTKDNGPLQHTGNQLDVAIEGPGYLSVTGPGNKMFYTRAGNFGLNAERQVVTGQGYPLLDTGGKPITMPEGQNDVLIGEDGSISGAEGPIAQIGVKEFDNIQLLKPVGNTLYETEATGKPSPTTRLVQGSVEGSNVQSVLEMTDMIEVSRSYQSVSRMLQNEHERLRSTIRTLTQSQ